MSTKDTKDLEIPETVIRCKTPPVAPLKHQHSFEQRYASLINQQILENSINKEVLQRQVQAFFPFSRSSSKDKKLEDSKQGEEEEEDKKEVTDMDVKVLQKLATLDIADKEQT